MASPARSGSGGASGGFDSSGTMGPTVDSPTAAGSAAVPSAGGTKTHEFEGRLILARHGRKLVEEDAQLLLNRIHLLQQEEQRVWKKIDRTKKKAVEITQTRKDAEARHAARQQWEAERLRDEESNMGRFVKQQEALRELRYQRAKEDATAKRRAVLDLKARKERDRVYAEQQRVAEQVTLKARAATIRMELEAAAKKREIEAAERLKKNRDAYNQRVEEEEAKKQEKEKEVSKLEKLEVKLITRLRDAQDLQQAAYKDLEDALTNPL